MSGAAPTVGFAGLTHLGIVSSAAAAAKGMPTVAFDADAALVRRLRRGDWPVHEPGLPELIAGNAERLAYTDVLADLGRCDLIYVCPDVPTDDRGGSDLGGLTTLLDAVVRAARPDAVLVILSQVPPGYTRAHAPEGRTVLCQVETLIFGAAVERAMKPERFIIGLADPAVPLPPALARYLGAFGCPVLPMRYESAELAKISINMFLVSSVATTNTLAELCERIGADWGEIAPALRLDRRIGPHAYLTPGLGIAGGNLERDLATVERLAGLHGTDAGVVGAWLANSRRRRDWVFDRLREDVLAHRAQPVLAWLGLAYKQDTRSIKNSPSLALLARIPEARIRAYDPAVATDPAFHPRIEAAADALDACRGADAVVIMTPWSEFRALDPKAVAGRLRGRVVLDPFQVLDRAAAREAGLVHHTLGRAPATPGGLNG
jgi:UDPglucose 6-dehydrogenase